MSCWIGSHVRCFEFLGGSPVLLVPDILKSGITTPDLFEPLVNETYREMAEHYSVAILPAHVKRPKDKWFFRESHGAKKMPNGLTRSQAG